MMIDQNTPVDYNDAQHLYSYAGRKYTSASQTVELFANEFKTQEVAERYAAKHGMTPEYWIQKWAEKNAASKVRGNAIHEANETALQGAMIAKVENRIMPVIGDTIMDEQPWYTRPDGVYLERKLWHHGYFIAGRADKIILRTEYDDLNNLSERRIQRRYADIEDYKTNEKLDWKSYQYKSGSYKMMKPPLAHLMDCNGTHYKLQLSIYMFMLEYQGFTPGNITVIHYPHPTEDNPNPKPIRYPIEYMKKEVVLMVNFMNRKKTPYAAAV